MKKLLILSTLIIVLSLKILAQNDSSIFTMTYMSSAPRFNHGTANDFLPWLYKNVEYPKSSLKDSISGRVIASFLIDSTGTLKNVIILKGVRNDLDSAVMRVLSLSPKWIPAKQENKSIGVPFTIPIDFDIEDPYFKKKIKYFSRILKRKNSTNH